MAGTNLELAVDTLVAVTYTSRPDQRPVTTGFSGGERLGTGADIDLDLSAFHTSLCREAAVRFDTCGYIPLAGLVTQVGLTRLRAAVAELAPLTSRKDFVMDCMGGTPRNMTTLGGQVISEQAPAISHLYQSDGLVEALGQVLGKQVLVADDPVERHVLNILHRPGDTHGYHVDDYPIALVIFIESPTCPEGCGRLEFCPAPGDLFIPQGSESHPPMTRSHSAGDAYILRSDRLNHRVQPIHDGCLRTVLNFAYGFAGEDVVRTPSASLLYT